MKRITIIIALAAALVCAQDVYGQCVDGVCAYPPAATFRPLRMAPRAVFAPIARRSVAVQYAQPLQAIRQYAVPQTIWNDPQPVYQPRTYRVFRQPVRGTCAGGVCN